MTLVFFIHAILVVIQFLQISWNWKRLSKKFSKVDIQMADYEGPKNLIRDMKLLTSMVMTAAVCKCALWKTFFSF